MWKRAIYCTNIARMSHYNEVVIHVLHMLWKYSKLLPNVECKRNFSLVHLSRVCLLSGSTNPHTKRALLRLDFRESMACSCWPEKGAFKIAFPHSCCRDTSARAVAQGHLSGPDTPIRGQQMCGRVSLEVFLESMARFCCTEQGGHIRIGFFDARCGDISALAVSQRHLS